MASSALSERHIDRVLSEELESSREFLQWFLARVFATQVLDGEISSCSTTIGHHRVDGETDILLRVEWRSGRTAAVHIEDKIGALPQPDQALRYLTAVDAESAALRASALVAPHAWLRRHPREAALYQARIAFEDVAEFFRSRAAKTDVRAGAYASELVSRLRWREQLFQGTQQRIAVRNALGAGELTDWNKAAADVIDSVNGLALQITDRQKSEGQNKESRFILFEESLSAYSDGQSPRMKLKTAEPNTPGRVSLEVRRAKGDVALRSDALRAGYAVTDTPAGSLVISATSPRLGALTIAKPVAAQIDRLEDAANLAQRLIEWWETR